MFVLYTRVTDSTSSARPDVPDPAADLGLTREGKPRQRAPRTRRPIAITPAMLEGAPDFAPVPREQTRYDGWTHDRQRAFIGALATTGCVRRAAHAIGMSEVGAYQLRKAPGGEAFAKAWEEAQTIAVAKLSDVALERAMYGIPVPVFRNGKQVAERRWYDNRLLSWVLKYHDPERYGGPMGHRVPPHVRKALFAEWEREHSASLSQHDKDWRKGFADKMESMRSRMTEAPGPGSSMMSRFAWSMTPFDLASLRHDYSTGSGPARDYDEIELETDEPEALEPGGPGCDDASAACDPEPMPPAPPRPTRADSEAHWAERDAERRLDERADIWATGNSQDANANAAAHWEAMVDAGRIRVRKE